MDIFLAETMCRSSEARAALLFDIRTGGILERLGGHTDVVTDVAFHPRVPHLLTACMDGNVRTFAPP